MSSNPSMTPEQQSYTGSNAAATDSKSGPSSDISDSLEQTIKGYKVMPSSVSDEFFTRGSPTGKVIECADTINHRFTSFEKGLAAYMTFNPRRTKEDYRSIVEQEILREIVVIKLRDESKQGKVLYDTMTEVASSLQTLLKDFDFEVAVSQSEEGTSRLRSAKFQKIVVVLRAYQKEVGLSNPARNLSNDSDYKGAEVFVNFNIGDVEAAVEVVESELKSEKEVVESELKSEKDGERIAKLEKILVGLKRIIVFARGMKTGPHADWPHPQSSSSVACVKELATAVIGSDTVLGGQITIERQRIARTAAAKSGSLYRIYWGIELITKIFVPDGYMLLATDRALGMWPLLIPLGDGFYLAATILHEAMEPNEKTIRVVLQSRQLAQRVGLEALFVELRKAEDQTKYLV